MTTPPFNTNVTVVNVGLHNNNAPWATTILRVPMTTAFTTTTTIFQDTHRNHHHKQQQDERVRDRASHDPIRRRRRHEPLITTRRFVVKEIPDNNTIVEEGIVAEHMGSVCRENDEVDVNDGILTLQKVNGRFVTLMTTPTNDTDINIDNPTSVFEMHDHVARASQPTTSTTTMSDHREQPPDILKLLSQKNHIVDGNYQLVSRSDAEYRYSVKDWLPIICSIFQSSTLQYTRGPIMAVMLWSLLLCTIQQVSSFVQLNHCMFRTNTIVQQLYTFTTTVSILPSSTIAHATTVTVLGLLLVFRTTSAYQKFDEGRLIWERILGLSRNITRQIYLYPEFIPVKFRILQLLAAYPYFLHQHVVKKIPTENTMAIAAPSLSSTSPTPTTRSVASNDDTNGRGSTTTRHPRSWKKQILRLWNRRASSRRKELMVDAVNRRRTRRKVISNELPWSLFLQPEISSNSNMSHNRQVIQQLMTVENRPLYICDEIGKEIVSVPYSCTYSSMERMVLLQFLNELTEAVSECERITHTSVPLNYARHSLRGLTIWLFTLPLTLLPTYDWWTAPIMGLTAWLYYGIYQIGYIVEDPFQRTIRLTTICETIYRDVICTEQRTTAFDDITLSGDTDGEWKDLPL